MKRINKWINKKNIIAFLFVFFVGILLANVKAQAEDTNQKKETVGEKYIYREASGDVEELSGFRLSDEDAEELLKQQEAEYRQWSGNTGEKTFLDCGSDYGYQDMLKRSNSTGRQTVYTQIEQASREFTLSDSDCTTIDLSGGTYYVAAALDIRTSQLTDTEIMEVYFTFRNDNPQYFWLSNRVAWGSGNIFLLAYNTYHDGAARSAAFEEIMQTAEDVYYSHITSEDSDYMKVKKIHDALIADIEYSADVDEEIAHSIAGAMTSTKSAVCEGYAKVMQLIMNAYEIQNIYVTGNGGGEAHAWNMVQMPDGKYYWLDATWDDQKDEMFQHNYFLVGNANFADHMPDSPESTGFSFLYELPAASDADYDPEQMGNVPGTGSGEIVKGDVTADSIVNIEDLRTVLRAVCGKITLDEQQAAAADVTGDQKVDINDLRMILRYVCDKITEL